MKSADAPPTNFDMFNLRMNDITKRMQIISKRTANMAMLGSADPSHPDFKELIKKYSKLDPNAFA